MGLFRVQNSLSSSRANRGILPKLGCLAVLVVLLGFFYEQVLAQEAPIVPASILYFDPAYGSFERGEEFLLDIFVDTQGEYINAVAAYFSYPQDKLKPLGVEFNDSVMMLIAERSADQGEVKISGGKSTPGFAGIQKVASVRFQIVGAGKASLAFHESSAVLRNADSRNILTRDLAGKASYNFVINGGGGDAAPTATSENATETTTSIVNNNSAQNEPSSFLSLKAMILAVILIISFLLIILLVYKKRSNPAG